MWEISQEGTIVFKNRFSLGLHVHTPCTHSRLIYFKHVHEQTNLESKTNKLKLKQKFALFGSLKFQIAGFWKSFQFQLNIIPKILSGKIQHFYKQSAQEIL